MISEQNAFFNGMSTSRQPARMMVASTSVFCIIDAVISWQKFSEEALVCEYSTPEERQSAAKAFLQLERHLGTNFLQEHPHLAYFFINRTRWPKMWAIWFANLLNRLQGHPQFDQLINELRRPDKYQERMTILNIVDRVLDSAKEIRFDVPTNVNGVTKKPDLQIAFEHCKNGILFEVSDLLTNSRERAANDVARQFFNLVQPWMPELAISGRVLRTLSPAHFSEVAAQIERTIKEVSTGKPFASFERAGVVESGVSTQQCIGMLQEWASARRMNVNELSGPAHNHSDLDRLAVKLRTEQQQLPRDGAGVVILGVAPMTATPGSQKDFEVIANALEEELFRYDHLAYAGILFQWLGSIEPGVLRYGNHLCINRCRFEWMCDSLILLKNRFARPGLSQECEQSFLGAIS
jgi:hypothetical protein